jgi:hypothetical protein
MRPPSLAPPILPLARQGRCRPLLQAVRPLYSIYPSHPKPLPHPILTKSQSITTKGHQAQRVFLDDVNTTYARILTRSVEIRKARASNPSATQDVEQIQLHAVDPNTTITINIPHASSTDPVEIAAREIFERFPPGLQRALESGGLDRVNEVLGKMSVSEAEEVVEQLGEGGMLSLEEGVIDGTTEEGRERLRGLEEKAKEEAEGKGKADGDGNEEKGRGESAGRVEEIEVADAD